MPHAESTPFCWVLVGSRNPKKVENKIIASRTHVNMRLSKPRKSAPRDLKPPQKCSVRENDESTKHKR